MASQSGATMSQQSEFTIKFRSGNVLENSLSANFFSDQSGNVFDRVFEQSGNVIDRVFEQSGNVIDQVFEVFSHIEKATEKPFKDAKLVLDEPLNTYYAGQLLIGHIECELKHEVNLKGIFVTFLGEGITKWHEWETEEYNGIRREKKIEYKGREEYFNVTQSLYGGASVTQLPKGQHKLPFSFKIPHKVPSTFSASHGRVRYHVTVFVDYADQGMERDILEKEFEVVVPFDLNTDEGKTPTGVEFEELYSCCCSSNLMNLRISLPHTGYCPGQSIPVSIEAKNESEAEVKTIIFQLVQKTAFRSSQPYSEYIPPEEVLQEIRTGPILRKTKRQINYSIPVPSMIAPNLDNCDIIDLGFSLKVKVKMSGCKEDLEDECEVVLGLIPVAGSDGSANYTHPMADRLPNAPLPEPGPEDTPVVANKETVTSSAYPTNDTPYSPGYPNTATPYANQQYPNNTSYPPPYPGTNSECIPLNDVKGPPPYPGVGFVVPGAAGNPPYPGNDAYPAAAAHTPLMPRSRTPEPSAPPLE